MNINIIPEIYTKEINKLNIFVQCEILDLVKYKKYKWLTATNCQILQIKNLFGGNIIHLDVSYNKLNKIEQLPLKLKSFVCKANKLLSMDNLPKNLINLNCSFNNIVNLNNLPNKLKYLNCSFCSLINLDYLPESLTHLDCSNNDLSFILNLPNGILDLCCFANPLNSLNIPLHMPLNIQKFNCSAININQIINILPTSIKKISIMSSYGLNIDLRKFNNLREIEITESNFDECYLPEFVLIVNLSGSKFNKINFLNSNPLNLNLYKIHINNILFYDIIPKSVKKMKISSVYLGNKVCNTIKNNLLNFDFANIVIT